MSIFSNQPSWKLACLAVLGVVLLLNTLHLFKADLRFHTDIARDFLVMAQIVETKSPTLIGPKSGGISGVFHGPAWYYLNLPVFYLSNGNPAVIAWFWLSLSSIALTAYYIFAKKIFDNKIALLATSLIAVLTIFMPKALGQQSPAFFLCFPFFYYIWKYLTNQKWLDLITALFLLGLLIQFQMAIGVPMALLIGTYVGYTVIVEKRYLHLLCYFVMLIPLSTFFVFDIRHDFLQSRAVLAYLASSTADTSFSSQYLWQRVRAILDSFSLLKVPIYGLQQFSGLLGLVAFIWASRVALGDSKKIKQASTISLIIIIGFWLVTLPFRGAIWSYYYEALLPIIAVWWTYLVVKKGGIISYGVFFFIIAANLSVATWNGMQYLRASAVQNEVDWRFYRTLAQDIYEKSHDPFGYYVFTTDQYAYQAKYALQFYGKKMERMTFPYQKKQTTILIIGPNDHRNPFADENYWQKEQVRIIGEPESMWNYPSGYQVKKYRLSDQEQNIPSDPNLISNLHFR